HQLGWAEGTVAGRLATARKMLARRLAQRDVGLSGGALAAVLSVRSASASAPPALVASTIKAASLLAAGQSAGVISAKVAALTEGVVKAMFVTKIKNVLAVVLVVGLAFGGIGVGVGFSTNTGAVAQEKTPDKAPPKDGKSPDSDARKRAELDLEQAAAQVEAAKAHLEQAKASYQHSKQALEKLREKYKGGKPSQPARPK